MYGKQFHQSIQVGLNECYAGFNLNSLKHPKPTLTNVTCHWYAQGKVHLLSDEMVFFFVTAKKTLSKSFYSFILYVPYFTGFTPLDSSGELLDVNALHERFFDNLLNQIWTVCLQYLVPARQTPSRLM
ncbi:hypothetical protein DPMN_051553 [Dreissena polymorpha]|uniref:Uncharacterized protein n=1 Tax=Dreissena polymorpha TaxID=45954 RepID=A0A9D4CI18_DREPO|nr:hypothetical protein DPMN_051553 [Dreissena polymorpha]